MTTTLEPVHIPKPEYQWQYWANRGKSSFAKGDSLRLRSNSMFRQAIAVVLISALALSLVNKLSVITGDLARWGVNNLDRLSLAIAIGFVITLGLSLAIKVRGVIVLVCCLVLSTILAFFLVGNKGPQLFSAGAQKTDAAPYINLPAPQVPFRGQTAVQFAPFGDVINEMRRLRTEFSGKAPEGCLANAQITEGWWTATEATPRCRLGGDGERLWVWAVVADGRGNPAPYMSLIRKSSGKNELFNVQFVGYGGLAIQGAETLDPNFIPRTFAHDFPELGGAK